MNAIHECNKTEFKHDQISNSELIISLGRNKNPAERSTAANADTNVFIDSVTCNNSQIRVRNQSGSRLSSYTRGQRIDRERDRERELEREHNNANLQYQSYVDDLECGPLRRQESVNKEEQEVEESGRGGKGGKNRDKQR